MPTPGPAKVSVTVFADNSTTLRITVTNPDGTLADLTGASAKWWMGTSPITSAQAKIMKSTAAGTMSIAGSVLVIPLDPEDTASIQPSQFYYHEAEVTDSNGDVVTVTYGSFDLRGTLIR